MGGAQRGIEVANGVISYKAEEGMACVLKERLGGGMHSK